MADTAIAYVRPDGAIAVRASAIGKCVRALWAALAGIESAAPSEVIERAFAEGHLHEKAVRDQIEATEDTRVVDDQREVELWVIPGKLVVVGHIDGIVENTRRLLEIKAMSSRAFADWVKKRFDYRPEYAWQISVYMLALENEIEGVDYRVKRRDDGLLDVWTFEEPPVSLKEIKLKAIRVLQAHKQGIMPPCDIAQDWFCPFFFLHDEAEDDDVDADVPTEDIPELDMLALEYIECKEVAKEAEKRAKELRKVMEEKYRKGRMEFATEHTYIKVYPKSRTSTDRAALVVGLGEEEAQKYDKTSEWEEWRVRERKR